MEYALFTSVIEGSSPCWYRARRRDDLAALLEMIVAEDDVEEVELRVGDLWRGWKEVVPLSDLRARMRA